MQQSDVYYQLLSQHVSGIIMPIFRRTKTVLLQREKTNKMQQSDVYYQFLSQHVSGIIMPIFRRTKTVLLQREKTNKMQQSDAYYQLLSQHVSGIIMPIFRRTKTVLLHVVHCSHPTTQRPTIATNHIQQNQSSTPHAVTRSLFS